MREFTYRTARSGALVVGLGFAILIETVALHLWLRPHHPVLAWLLTVSSLSAIVWLVADFQALGRGAIRVEGDAIDLRVGRRANVRVPLRTVALVVRPSWREVPAAGEPESKDYLNLMKPATPNVLVTLTAPTPVVLLGAVARPVRRFGLLLDDADGFIAAVDGARGTVGAPASARIPDVRRTR